MAGAMTQWRPFLRLTNAFRGSSRGITKSATRSSGPGPSTSRTQEELSDYVKREAAGGVMLFVEKKFGEMFVKTY
jgi:hypothetical protein